MVMETFFEGLAPLGETGHMQMAKRGRGKAKSRRRPAS
jgi:hypothetical protein